MLDFCRATIHSETSELSEEASGLQENQRLSNSWSRFSRALDDHYPWNGTTCRNNDTVTTVLQPYQHIFRISKTNKLGRTPIRYHVHVEIPVP
jgi:hypothetical protein